MDFFEDEDEGMFSGEDEDMFDEDDEEEMLVMPRGSSVAGPLSDASGAIVPRPKGFRAVISNLLYTPPASQGDFSFGGRASLPPTPGLQVEGLGTVPLPLRSPFAEQLVAACERSPYGKDFDTLVDDSVRKSWQLAPDKVSFTNPEWDAGMKKLVEGIAERLGYRGIPLACPLYKLLVYGPGGHFVRHKDTEKADGMFATLVLQLPSIHEGGDLVVYDGKKSRESTSSKDASEDDSKKEEAKGEEMEKSDPVEVRHSFGKDTGVAPFAVHYAVHYADAEHALEEVTNGYRLVLVYSLCLPANMRELNLAMATSGGDSEQDKRKAVMAFAIKGLVTNDQLPEEEAEEQDDGAFMSDETDPLASCFTLMFMHEYTESSINRLGCGALKGNDRERFLKLQAANESLPLEYRLQFYVVKLSYDIEYYDTGGGGYSGRFDWEESERSESVVAWHASGGNKLSFKRAHPTSGYGEPSKKFPLQFLNPDNWSLGDLWGGGGTNKYEGYMGNESATKSTKYCRYGLVAWPLALDAAHSYTYIGDSHAANILREQRPLTAKAVDVFLRTVEEITPELTNSNPRSNRKPPLSAEFCRSLIELLEDAKDARLVCFFFDHIFLRVDRKMDVSAPLTALIAKFEWKEIGPSILAFLSNFKPWGEPPQYYSGIKSTECINAIQLAVRLAEGMLEVSASSQEAAQALARVAVDRIKTIVWVDLPSIRFVTLWKMLAALDDTALQSELLSHFQTVDADFTKTLVNSMSKVAVSNAEFRIALQEMAERRLAWLNQKINEAANAPALSWEIPGATFPRNAQVEAFLHGPEQRMMVRNMSGIQEARRFVQQYGYPGSQAFTMEAGGRGRDAHVVITKTRQSRDAKKAETVAMHQEAQQLAHQFGGEAAPLPVRVVEASTSVAAISATSSGTPNSRKRRQRQ